MFGTGFEETMQHSPLLGVGGLLADRDLLSSPGYEAYHADRLGGTLSVWAETRDAATNLALRSRTYAYSGAYDTCPENEIIVYAECHEVK